MIAKSPDHRLFVTLSVDYIFKVDHIQDSTFDNEKNNNLIVFNLQRIVITATYTFIINMIATYTVTH